MDYMQKKKSRFEVLYPGKDRVKYEMRVSRLASITRVVEERLIVFQSRGFKRGASSAMVRKDYEEAAAFSSGEAVA